MTPEQQKMVDSKLYTRQPDSEPPVRSSELVRRLFSEQFRICNADSTCQHMSKANHDAMPPAEQKRYAEDKRFMVMAADYFGPRGPLFCGASPGICSSQHCPKRDASNENLSAGANNL